MVDLGNAWAELPLIQESPRPFPLTFDESSLATIQDDCEKAIHGMQIMNEICTRLGPLWPDKDAVSHENYVEAKAALRALKEEVMQGFARSEGDKKEFQKLWAFDD